MGKRRLTGACPPPVIPAMGARIHIAFSASTMTIFRIRRFLRTNFRKAGILVGCEVGQSVGLLEGQDYFLSFGYEGLILLEIFARHFL